MNTLKQIASALLFLTATFLLSTGISYAGGNPPSTPGNLQGVITGNQVTLTWTASSNDDGKVGYNVYFNGQYKDTVFGNSYTGTLETGLTSSTEVSFYLHAFGPKPHLYSQRSEELVLQIAASPIGVSNPPSAPGNLIGAINNNGEVTIAWEASSDNNGVISYDVYRDGILRANVSQQWYREPNVPNVVRRWAVSARDSSGNRSNFSREIRLPESNTPVASSAAFSLQVAASAFNILEGNAQYLNVPIKVVRSAGFNTAIQLSVATQAAADEEQLDMNLSRNQLYAQDNSSTLNVKVGIGNLPIRQKQIRLTITASSGGYTQTATVTLQVTPVQRDDIYLLIGQSNMVGTSEIGAKQKGSGEPDEPNPRIVQFNFKQNSASQGNPMSENLYFLDQPFINNSWTFTAEDPLHEPYAYKNNDGRMVGMGLSFAKTALQNTTQRIVLVPAAYSGSSFCKIVDGVPYSWNADLTGNANLGNTALFDRAVRRVNEVLLKTGGILRGILWHQGESDSLVKECADLYEYNLVHLAESLRSRIRWDLRGSSARSESSDVPFVVGTMSKGRGSSPANDFSVFTENKKKVDSVHRNISSLLAFSAVTNNDDLVPPQYPCGAGSCVHFGAAALREMGVRTYESMLRAAGN